MQSESSTDTAAESWTSPLEAFLQKAELRQTLRSLQLEALVFPYKPTSGFVQALSTLSTDIQAYLARIGEQEIVCSEQKSTELGASVVQNRMGREEVRQAMADAVEKQRAEINANNRDEFLLSRPEGETTCARTDTKPSSTGVQVETVDQSSVSQSNVNALERSTKNKPADSVATKPNGNAPLEYLGERVENIREHLNIRFEHDESADVYRRVRAMEDWIMHIEREIPGWAAQNFNQPGTSRSFVSNRMPPQVVYRVLQVPSGGGAPDTSTAATSNSQQQSARGAGKGIGRPGSSVSMSSFNGNNDMAEFKPFTSPRRSTDSNSTRASATPKKKRKTGAAGTKVATPVDALGKPIFHLCGRGVNSSLTRTVLAQLQSRQKQSAEGAGQDSAASGSAH